ncbi:MULTISPECIES: 8-amino-7-oxononanoate synthase [unclassified Arcicella]|uniref:aminotransferase class I/II-fold pyridoxal phosphate-dependent enzyme n=1 Tax=unclassified Arcicella TaxID=2644986 RepID=UPI002861F324|nr:MULTISPECIES: 8-amino-7-oxononanoate synthase [unclassified Arcicella]MDR6560276.1 8-amino-7-oxononanoate synthase [Arcicella sp. BE51]MDR6810118.1 8-amino-7-oxononanoate synthase [Arcicella sp. BE140]MDR6821467.1 8-amino-7-oxononanoate synthase [Arcicella sp. BE139]
MISLSKRIETILEQRKEQSLFRTLRISENLIDFCSNDYLGFARSEKLQLAIHQQCKNGYLSTGATGSRLLAGNTAFVENLEKQIANFHRAESGLIFNSGYDANVGLLSSIPQKNDFLITDELIHASMIDGARLSYATRYKFRHNDVEDLTKKLAKIEEDKTANPLLKDAQVFVAIESVYSMDGDLAPLLAIVDTCAQFGANLIVDEAHATGVFGKHGEGLVNELQVENKVFARIITFGKALGCHGAIIVGSNTLRNYLINFARSFIYTTSAPMHSHISVQCAYDLLQSDTFSNKNLHHLIDFFKRQARLNSTIELIESPSAIQCIIISGNENCRAVANTLQSKGLDIRPIVSPTVPKGKERLRICLHDFNTEEQILQIFEVLNKL